jgi:hypothetical protein
MSLVVHKLYAGGSGSAKKTGGDGIHDSSLLTLAVNIVSECALDIPGNVCSTDATVDDMKAFLKDRNVDQSKLATKEQTVDVMKKETKCTTERCILEDQNFKDVGDNTERSKSMDNLKPKGPSHTTALLNNKNIDEVLRKLTHVHSGFYHMNFQMIDFAGIKNGSDWKIEKNTVISPTELGSIDIVDDIINKGFKTFGVVMNTDKRTGGGIHWFALFCDFRYTPYTVEYFNSSGNKPVEQIQDWMAKTESRINTHGKCTPVILSGVVHQTASETECGPYSLYYIWNRLNGKPASNFQQHPIPDAKMIQFRKMLFA